MPGLVRGTRDGRRVVYELTPEPFADAARWMSEVGAAWDDPAEPRSSDAIERGRARRA